MTLTYKKRNRLLLAVFILFMMISWKLALSGTASLYFQCRELAVQLEQAVDASRKFSTLKVELKTMERDYDPKNTPSASSYENLLTVVSNYCQKEGTVLRDFPKTGIHVTDDFVLETNTFTIEGSFIRLLKLIYLLEGRRGIGKVSSVLFFSKKDLRSGILSLYSTVYIQNIKKKYHAPV